MSKHVLIDRDTGEELPVRINTHIPKHRYAFEGVFMAMTPDVIKKIREDKLGINDIGVFGVLLDNAEYGNRVLISTKLIADELGIASQSVSRAIRKLVDKDFIFDNRKIGKGFLLNPDLVWYGSAKSHNEYMKENLKKSLQ